jgi:hypothetical protein
MPSRTAAGDQHPQTPNTTPQHLREIFISPEPGVGTAQGQQARLPHVHMVASGEGVPASLTEEGSVGAWARSEVL